MKGDQMCSQYDDFDIDREDRFYDEESGESFDQYVKNENDDWDDLDDDEKLWRESEEIAAGWEEDIERTEQGFFDYVVEMENLACDLHPLSEVDSSWFSRQKEVVGIERAKPFQKRDRGDLHSPEFKTNCPDSEENGPRSVLEEKPSNPGPAAAASGVSWWLSSMISAQKKQASGEIEAKVVGVTYENRQHAIANLQKNDPVTLRRDRNNRHDSSAIAIIDQKGQSLGFLPRDLAAKYATDFDRSGDIRGFVVKISSSGQADSILGLVIRFRLPNGQ
jgi:hypothetical protein